MSQKVCIKDVYHMCQNFYILCLLISVGPRAEIFGNYENEDSSKGQYIRVEFGKVVMVSEFVLASTFDCEIKSFKVCYKTQPEDIAWTYISLDGTDVRIAFCGITFICKSG